MNFPLSVPLQLAIKDNRGRNLTVSCNSWHFDIQTSHSLYFNTRHQKWKILNESLELIKFLNFFIYMWISFLWFSAILLLLCVFIFFILLFFFFISVTGPCSESQISFICVETLKVFCCFTSHSPLNPSSLKESPTSIIIFSYM